MQPRSSPRANAFASACERVRFRVQTRSLLLTNVFASPNERKRLFRWRLTVASTRLQPHFHVQLLPCMFVWVKGHQQFGGRLSRCVRYGALLVSKLTADSIDRNQGDRFTINPIRQNVSRRSIYNRPDLEKLSRRSIYNRPDSEKRNESIDLQSTRFGKVILAIYYRGDRFTIDPI